MEETTGEINDRFAEIRTHLSNLLNLLINALKGN